MGQGSSRALWFGPSGLLKCVLQHSGHGSWIFTKLANSRPWRIFLPLAPSCCPLSMKPNDPPSLNVCGSPHSPLVEVQKWVSPPPGTLKTNFDGALSIRNPIVGIGLVVRNSEGLFLLGRIKSLVGMSDALLVEALTAKEAVLFGKDLREVIVEGNAQSVINDLQLSTASTLICGAYSFTIYSLIFRLTFIWSRRTCDGCADILAKLALDVNQEETWLDTAAIVLLDCLSSH